MSKELTIFYMEGCPYCINARRALKELQEQSADYAAVPVRWIDENKEAALADSYDYYRVPTIYLERQKLYEASPAHRYEEIRRRVEEALQTAMAE
ncbi:MAG: glutaredoxin family protein [Clostridia bacterium]|nr:glutaredoxin family protein [Clostridia bacterium]